ncbi:MAG: tRNA (adenosine(37)-N6)-dimethylallyltransferase MiaA [Candidatus Omnitrophica bacterium]|nr:tRNA (adenosine(37)-N6)-dimethylallyltransferase MiaA [Candidatus Omnitrophota bacterium]
MKPKIIFLVGPTASGKSEVAIELASRIGAEIISCDSMQVYRGMQILTASPRTTLRKKLLHHLIGYVNPTKEYNVAIFRRDALKVIKKIIKKKRVPLFVGGSGLYYKVLLDGIFEAKIEDKKIRNKLYNKANRYGTDFLYGYLRKIDPPSAKKIHPHDLKRIARAIEVYEKTGIPISEWQKKTKGLSSDYNVIVFGLLRPKEIIYKRIKHRIEDMFKKGLIEEVKRLLRFKLSKTARQAIGIAEVAGYLEFQYDLNEVKRRMYINSVKLVKKQLTWFKRDHRIVWINIGNRSDYSKIAKEIIKKINAYGKSTSGNCKINF